MDRASPGACRCVCGGSSVMCPQDWVSLGSWEQGPSWDTYLDRAVSACAHSAQSRRSVTVCLRHEWLNKWRTGDLAGRGHSPSTTSPSFSSLVCILAPLVPCRSLGLSAAPLYPFPLLPALKPPTCSCTSLLKSPLPLQWLWGGSEENKMIRWISSCGQVANNPWVSQGQIVRPEGKIHESPVSWNSGKTEVPAPGSPGGFSSKPTHPSSFRKVPNSQPFSQGLGQGQSEGQAGAGIQGEAMFRASSPRAWCAIASHLLDQLDFLSLFHFSFLF